MDFKKRYLKITVILIILFTLSLNLIYAKDLIVTGCVKDKLTNEPFNFIRVDYQIDQGPNSKSSDMMYYITNDALKDDLNAYEPERPNSSFGGKILLNNNGCFKFSIFDNVFNINNFYGASFYFRDERVTTPAPFFTISHNYVDYNYLGNEINWEYALSKSDDILSPTTVLKNITNDIDDYNVTLGDIYQYPSAVMVLNSDIPVTLFVKYFEEGERTNGSGNSGLKEGHIVRGVVPIAIDCFIENVDENGNLYQSPYFNAPIGTKLVVANFDNNIYSIEFFTNNNYTIQKKKLTIGDRTIKIKYGSEKDYNLSISNEVTQDNKVITKEMKLMIKDNKNQNSVKEIELKSIVKILEENNIDSKQIKNKEIIIKKIDNSDKLEYTFGLEKRFKLFNIIPLWKYTENKIFNAEK